MTDHRESSWGQAARRTTPIARSPSAPIARQPAPRVRPSSAPLPRASAPLPRASAPPPPPPPPPPRADAGAPQARPSAKRPAPAAEAPLELAPPVERFEPSRQRTRKLARRERRTDRLTGYGSGPMAHAPRARALPRRRNGGPPLALALGAPAAVLALTAIVLLSGGRSSPPQELPARGQAAPAATAAPAPAEAEAAEPAPEPEPAPAPPRDPELAPGEDPAEDEAARLEWLKAREAELRQREEAWLEELGRSTGGSAAAEEDEAEAAEADESLDASDPE